MFHLCGGGKAKFHQYCNTTVGSGVVQDWNGCNHLVDFDIHQKHFGTDILNKLILKTANPVYLTLKR